MFWAEKNEKAPDRFSHGFWRSGAWRKRGRGLSLRGLRPTHRKCEFLWFFNGFQREMKASDKVKIAGFNLIKGILMK